MGLLHKLWDDSLAGPCPDSGLDKLRRTTITNSAMATASTPEYKEALKRLTERRPSVEFQRSNDEAIQVTQSITIIKPPYPRSLSVSKDSTSYSQGSSLPFLPSSLAQRERENPWRSNKYINVAAAAKKESENTPRVEPRSPTVYDWVVFSDLDG